MDAVTSAYVLDSHTYEHDEEGYLKNLGDWNKELAELIAKDEKIDMTPGALGGRQLPARVLRGISGGAGHSRPGQGHEKAVRTREGRAEVSLSAVPLRPGEAGVQDRRVAEADRLRLRRGHRRWASAERELSGAQLEKFSTDVQVGCSRTRNRKRSRDRADRRVCTAVLCRCGGAGGGTSIPDLGVRPNAGPAENSDTAGAHDPKRRCAPHLARGRIVRQPFLRRTNGSGFWAGCSTPRC